MHKNAPQGIISTQFSVRKVSLTGHCTSPFISPRILASIKEKAKLKKIQG